MNQRLTFNTLMTLPILLLLILLTLFLLLANKRKAAVSALMAVLAFTYLTGSGVLAGVLLPVLQIHPPVISPEWKKSNLILVLGYGIDKHDGSAFSSQSFFQSRLLEAVRLYLDCKKQKSSCTVLVSGGDPGEHGMPEADVMASELIHLGVPDAEILRENKSYNTFQNAQFSSEMIRSQTANPYDLVVLVTSGTHMQRALAWFSVFKIQPLPAPSDRLTAEFSLRPHSRNFYLADIALHECGGLLLYFIKN